MTTGEKRSVTSSMKKAAELFLEKHAGKLSSFTSKDSFITDFFTYWVNYSVENRLSWCYDKKDGEKKYHLKKEFRTETEDKIKDIFASELVKITEHPKQLSSIGEVARKLPPLRSKKKRLRKKWEKKQQAI